ncbi:hypothetical protein J2Y69_000715 [Microbacterium resistens]|uniref:PQQ-binding-like beta-propeller repeat protein n=1 Tax=Microbacterium resistens TaxID=156977 RepID=A0ABU1S968_9MICO|nr:hypothetical protein [Microbacterium resistens]MDR6866130.1 hypothetical protein [Microbacterium resistens]
MKRLVVNRLLIGGIVLAGVVALGACTASGPGPVPSDGPATPSDVNLHPSVPEGAWLAPGYAAGFSEPITIEGKLCGASADGAVVVQAQGGDGEPDSTNGWDARTGEQRWALPARGCTGVPDSDEVLTRPLGDESGTGVVERRAAATGALLSSWPMPDATLSPYIAEVDADVAVVIARPAQTDDDSPATQITFADTTSGDVLWKYAPSEGFSNVFCSVQGIAPFAWCQTTDPGSQNGWSEIRSLRNGTPLTEHLPLDTEASFLTDGFATVGKAGGSARLVGIDGDDIGAAPAGLPQLLLPGTARLPLEDASAWSGVVATDENGRPVVVREGSSLSWVSGHEIAESPVAISGSGKTLALFTSDAAGRTDRISLTDSKGEAADEVTTAHLNTSQVQVEHGLLVVHGLVPDGDGYRTIVIPPAS